MHILSKAEIDAIVTVALRWTESGALEYMPAEAAQVLRVTPENASEVGTRLWSANYDSYWCGGPRDLVDPEIVAEQEQWVLEAEPQPEYAFAEFPGTPAPEVVLALTHLYRSPTRCDHWDQPDLWANGEPPWVARFIVAMEWHAMAVLGLASAERVPSVEDWLFEWHHEFEQDRYPAYQRVRPGLDDGDRQLFTTTALGTAT